MTNLNERERNMTVVDAAALIDTFCENSLGEAVDFLHAVESHQAGYFGRMYRRGMLAKERNLRIALVTAMIQFIPNPNPDVE